MSFACVDAASSCVLQWLLEWPELGNFICIVSNIVFFFFSLFSFDCNIFLLKFSCLKI